MASGSISMAGSLNSVIGFYINSRLQAKYQHHGHQHQLARSYMGASMLETTQSKSSLDMFGSRIHLKVRRGLCVSVADSDHLATNEKGPEDAESSVSDSQPSALSHSSADSLGGNRKFQTSPDHDELGLHTTRTSNGSMISADLKKEMRPNLQSTPKKSPLTVRERLKAARVLSRYTESKASKSETGSKVLDALKETDQRKKRSGLPEAPTDLFDDSRRGLPKQGWTFKFPGGSDLFVIVFSFVFISTVMFATTYIVWKVGAIHFNEY